MSIRIVAALADIPAAQWDALHDGGNPFVCHAFLSALESSGTLRADWGWDPMHVTIWDRDTLQAAAPLYRKTNSHGEFVFDFAWARAYADHGRDYYPKGLCAVPYSPVTGPRLLARDPAAKRQLLAAMVALCEQQGLSSMHVNFHDDADEAAFALGPQTDAWLPRTDIQYHWENRDDWRDFEQFLAAMDHKHRKNIRQERRKVRDAGVTFRHVDGHTASEADIAAMHGLYLQTFAEYGNSPALTLEFFFAIAEHMPQALVMILAEHHGRIVAGAWCLQGRDTLHGRYWGSRVQLPGLHFDTCYYQGIEHCLRSGLRRFEPGAQGEHKLARGFLPSRVRSRHWIAEPAFRAALRGWCRDESIAIERYARQLEAHSPFKDTGAR